MFFYSLICPFIHLAIYYKPSLCQSPGILGMYFMTLLITWRPTTIVNGSGALLGFGVASLNQPLPNLDYVESYSVLIILPKSSHRCQVISIYS